MKFPLRKGGGRARSAALLDELTRPQLMSEGRLVGSAKIADGASLVAADLAGADLRLASLKHADLRRANLSGANLSGADLSGADLEGADLTGVSFRGARMLDTIFHGADLEGADFTLVSGLTAAAVRGARSINSVKWPKGFSTIEPRSIGRLIHDKP